MQFRIFKNPEKLLRGNGVGKNIIQGISGVRFGSMIGKEGDERAIKFLNSLGYKADIKNLIWAEQVFGSNVHICKKEDVEKIIKGADGLISNIENQILAIVTADCVPILLFDPKNKVVAALHGSRKSLIKRIIKKAIKKMILNFNSKPKEILVGIGPHIRKCHYEMDLTKIAINDFLKSGLKRKNIEDSGICTFCQFKKYFSARKKEEDPKIYKERTPRFASFIGLKTPQILKFSPKKFNFLIQKMVESIKRGEVLVLPTDTVYGLVADATNKKAVEKLFKIKKRDLKKPIPIFVRDIEMAKKLAIIDKEQEKFLAKAWPGKVTVVLKRTRLRQGFGGRGKIYGLDKKTIAIRIPNYRFLNMLLKEINRPLTGTSANISGKPATTKIKEVLKQFENKIYQPDIILDAGNLPKSRPSKVIDLTGKKIRILRK